jgi:TRAP-type C4-dicarboxylate transport system substrate-binding protein
VPGNLYDGSFAIIMNPKKFESLSKEDQDAIMAVTGEKISAYAGSKWAAADKVGYETAKAAGTTVSEATPEMVDQLKKVAATLEADWIKRASGKGYDPAAALKELRETAKALDKK